MLSLDFVDSQMFGMLIFWGISGLIQLCILTYSDIKTMKIDDRLNYFMYGMSIALLMVISRNVLYLVAVSLIILFVNMLLRFKGILAQGDISAMNWIIYGFAIFGMGFLTTFWIIFIVFWLIFNVAARNVLKIKSKLPFFGVILVSYIFTFCYILYGGIKYG